MTDAEAALLRARRIDQACDQFESAFKAGKSPRVDDIVAHAPESDRDSLRSALVAIERELREKSAADTSVTRSSLASPAPLNADATALHRSDEEPLPRTIGRFEILGVLGKGAFGRVFRARDPQLGREVAIKMPLAATMSPGEKERFLREAKSAATINHPNVCQIYESGEQEGRPYIVMASIPGQTLAEVLKLRKEVLPAKQVAQVVRKIALALAAAHDRGIVHRDLKPGNVMFDRERKDVVVMDFGLARGPQIGDARATQSGVIMGTPAYMSPEQARGDSKEVGPAGDIYALGVILYELLTGTRPFSGTATEVIGQILHVEPEPPSKRNSGVDPSLEAICLRAMAKEPAQRYASMKELAKALELQVRSAASPVSPSTDTARASDTKNDAEKSTSDGPHLSEVFAALSADRKAHQSIVEKAIKGSRTPPWVWSAIVLTMLGGFIALGAIVFFNQNNGVRVTIQIDGVDLKDQTLSFLLDNRPITAKELEGEVELSIGEHELLVKQGDIIIKKMKIVVKGKKDRVIKVQDMTPAAQIAPVALDHRALAEWTLSVDGKVRVAPSESLPTTWNEYGAFPLLTKGATLPEGDFKIVGLEINNAAANEAELEKFRGIDSLYLLWFSSAPITAKGLANFAACKNLGDCALYDAQNLGDDAVPILAKFKNLEKLSIDSKQLTDDGLAELASLTKLQWLACGPEITGKGLSALQSMPALRTLDIKGQGPTDAGMATLANFRGIEWLSIQRADGLSDTTLATIGKLPQLTTLEIGSKRYTNDGVAHLGKLTRLTLLRLMHSPSVTDEGIKHLSPLWRLTHLDLGGCEVSGTCLKELHTMPELHALHLHSCPITNEAIADIPGQDKLSELGLANSRVTEAAVEQLEKFKALRQLNVEGTTISNDGLLRLKKTLPQCHILPEPKDDRQAAKYALTLNGSIRLEGKPDWISKESQLPAGQVRLTGLNLDGKRNIRNHDLAMFQDCTELRDILLDRVGVTDEGLGYFRKNTKVTSVNIIDAKITNEGMSVFDNWTELKHLWAMGTQINGSGVAHLAKCKGLQTLDLSFTQVGSPGMVHLKDCLELKLLGLSGTRVDDAGLRNFDRCAKLTQVYLTNMSIGDFGIATFAGCNQMATMNLAETKVTDDVFKTLKTLPNLKSVNVKKTNVTQSAIDSFRAEKAGCKVER
jgi:serine/threonine protein kinase